ncbi:MAG: hypothetical protein IT370_00960 [Deltaproteobacteria bacterium]|nr:hypothetical protein [Deltaproteobacteria bacterium]
MLARALLLALAVAALPGAGCSRKRATPAPAPARSAPSGPPFSVAVEPPTSCAVGAACLARVQVTALGAFHVNREYPYKIALVDSPGVATEQRFTVDSDQRGTVTLTCRPSVAGAGPVTGTLHLSVCSSETCVIEEVPVSVTLPGS